MKINLHNWNKFRQAQTNFLRQLHNGKRSMRRLMYWSRQMLRWVNRV